jgi:uncharacterized protein
MKVLDLYITKVCNLDCEYCYVDVVKQEKHAFQVEDFLERVDLLKYDVIKFFGGEPLVRWEMIQKIVESVSEKNTDISFVIVTNGILLNEEKIQYITNHQKIDVVISIHE